MISEGIKLTDEQIKQFEESVWILEQTVSELEFLATLMGFFRPIYDTLVEALNRREQQFIEMNEHWVDEDLEWLEEYSNKLNLIRAGVDAYSHIK